MSVSVCHSLIFFHFMPFGLICLRRPGPVAEEQMYGVGFVVEEVALLLHPRDFGGLSGAPATPLSTEDLDTWLTVRLGSVTGQVMSLSKVRGGWTRKEGRRREARQERCWLGGCT